MTINEFLTLATRVTLVFIAVITIANYVRHRDQTRLDIALMFSSLALITALGRFREVIPDESVLERWLQLGSQMALMAHPYLFLRLVLDFRPVPQRIWWLAWLGMIWSWAFLLVFPEEIPLPVTLLLVVYFVYVELYAVVAFAKGALNTAGVTRWRLTLAAAGSGLFALVIFNAGLALVLPAAAPLISFLSQFVGLLSMICYFLGFATPQWLRHHWQLLELERYLKQTSGPWAGACRQPELCLYPLVRGV